MGDDDIIAKAEAYLKQPLLGNTPGHDARFPNMNQAKNCWTNFVEYQKCIAARGEDYEPCQYFFRSFTSLCPHAWVETWNDQLENGVFPGLKDKHSHH